MTSETAIEQRSSVRAGSFPSSLEAISSWILGFGLILFLAVHGGGFDPALFGQVGIFAWLVLLLGALLGLMPATRQRVNAWAAVGLLAALTAWSLLGLTWTDSPDKTFTEVARLSTYTAIFVLGLAARGRARIGQQIGALAAAIGVVALLGLSSRYFPDLFADAGATGKVLTSEAARLTFPLDYWNGLAALLAIGVPLIAQTAGGAARVAVRVAATAALPLVFLALYLTLSRSGLLAAAVALLAFHLLTRKTATLALSALGLAGGFVLIELARVRPAFESGLSGSAAHDQGHEMLLFSLAICLLTGLAGLGLIRLQRYRRPVRMAVRSGRGVVAPLAGIFVILVLAFALAGGPGRTADAWNTFKSSGTPTEGADRLGTASGNGRYQLWSSGLRQFKASPVLGEGPGTFEYWWAKHGDRPGFVRDTHSLYIQTLGEYGLVGFLLLAGFLTLVATTGLKRSLARTGTDPSWLAAALAGCLAFAVSAAFDWVWQIPVIVSAFLLSAATVLSSSPAARRVKLINQMGGGEEIRSSTAAVGVHPPLKSLLPDRFAVGTLAILGILALAVPVSSRLLLNESQQQVRNGDLGAALDSASAARWISRGTAAPLIQEAGILDLVGKTDAAIRRARRATELEPANWRNWYVLARLQRDAGRPAVADAAMERARKLNPRSPLFTE